MAYDSQLKYQPDKDAGWGLIFRLNALWEKVDRRAEIGDYEGWEVVLDRVFSNLMYRGAPEVISDGNGGISDVQINDEDYKVYLKVKEKIMQVKSEITKAKREKSYSKIQIAKLRHYQILMFYDIWLRKFMQSRDLYLKETEHNPGRALFGR